MDIIDKFKIPIALSLVGVVLIIGGLVSSNLSSKPATAYPQFPKESLVSAKQISVDVSGAVKNSGVYQIKPEGRIEDAIVAAGGIAENANQQYISKYLNLAQKLSDGMKIYVPYEGDPAPVGAGQGGVVAGASTNGQVNINSASQSELEALSGIGPVTAAKIISGRPYSKIEDLLNQKIVSKSVYEKIKDSIVIY